MSAYSITIFIAKVILIQQKLCDRKRRQSCIGGKNNGKVSYVLCAIYCSNSRNYRCVLVGTQRSSYSKRTGRESRIATLFLQSRLIRSVLLKERRIAHVGEETAQANRRTAQGEEKIAQAKGRTAQVGEKPARVKRRVAQVARKTAQAKSSSAHLTDVSTQVNYDNRIYSAHKIVPTITSLVLFFMRQHMLQ